MREKVLLLENFKLIFVTVHEGSEKFSKVWRIIYFSTYLKSIRNCTLAHKLRHLGSELRNVSHDGNLWIERLNKFNYFSYIPTKIFLIEVNWRIEKVKTRAIICIIFSEKVFKPSYWRSLRNMSLRNRKSMRKLFDRFSLAFKITAWEF